MLIDIAQHTLHSLPGIELKKYDSKRFGCIIKILYRIACLFINRLANDIWGELSDYAKDVIRNRAHDGVSPEPLWYETLGKEDIGTFRTEREARSETGRDNIGYCCKLRKPCRIIYTDKDEENICEKVLIKDIRRGIVTIERNGSDFTVDVESIISCVPLE